MTYNYSRFDPRAYDLAHFRGPRPGTRAPDATLRLAGGGCARLLEFQGDFLVLEMGSLTCPLFQGRRPPMAKLADRFPKTSFAVLYVREAHPGHLIPAHADIEDKAGCAQRLVTDGGERRRVFVDGIEGRLHSAYGGYPNAVFIINRRGCVVYASDWNNPSAVAQALRLLAAGKPAAVRAFFRPVRPGISLRVLRQGGRGALSDFLRGLPRLIWHNLVVRNLRLLARRPASVAPDLKC